MRASAKRAGGQGGGGGRVLAIVREHGCVAGEGVSIGQRGCARGMRGCAHLQRGGGGEKEVGTRRGVCVCKEGGGGKVGFRGKTSKCVI